MFMTNNKYYFLSILELQILKLKIIMVIIGYQHKLNINYLKKININHYHNFLIIIYNQYILNMIK